MVTFVTYPSENESERLVHEWYVNGTFQGSSTSYYNPNNSFSLENKLWIGIGDGRSNNNPFKGKIDDIRFYRGT